MVFKQGRIFFMSHLLWHTALVFTIYLIHFIINDLYFYNKNLSILFYHIHAPVSAMAYPESCMIFEHVYKSYLVQNNNYTLF